MTALNVTSQTVSNVSSKPWYREPWPWILMAGPAVVVVAGFITAWFAYASNDGLVEDDYYKEGLAINQRIERDLHATTLGISANVMLGGESKEIRLFLSSTEGAQLPSELVFRLMHPTHSGADEQVRLQVSGDGFYAGALAHAISGRWHVVVEEPNGQWRLTGKWNVNESPVLRLVPIAGSSSLTNDAGR